MKTSPASDEEDEEEEEERDYIRRVIGVLRSRDGPVEIGHLPRYPSAIKNKFGKASHFFAAHPQIFDCSPPWIELAESFKTQEDIDDGDGVVASQSSSNALVGSNSYRTVATIDKPTTGKIGVDAIIVVGNKSTYHKPWAVRPSDNNDENGPVVFKTDVKLPLFSVMLSDGSVVDRSFSCFDSKWTAEGRVCLAQISLSVNTAALVDPLSDTKLGDELTKESVLQVFSQANYLLMHDLRRNAINLGGDFFTHIFNRGTKLLDTQLVSELISYTNEKGPDFDGLNAYLKKVNVVPFQDRHKFRRAMRNNAHFWEKRPLSADTMGYAASDVLLLQASIPTLLNHLGDLSLYHQIDVLEMLCEASKQRLATSLTTEGRSTVSFLPPYDYTMRSSELTPVLEAMHILSGKNKIENKDESNDKIDGGNKAKEATQGWYADTAQNWAEICRDFVLDCSRRPYVVTMSDRRIFLSENEAEVVSEEDIANVVRQLGPNSFGPDNRAGIAGQLHRISAVRNKKNDIIGLTVRVGRLFHGNAYIIADLLLSGSHREDSILVLGPPGSGKTSFIREIARILALRQTVFIVDTSNEICGDEDMVHACVGDARRMMVPRIEDQHAVMIECLQNHSPSVMVIDEIGRASEAKAALTCKTRGVRMIASAHGDFASLMANNEMEDLIGGKKDVTLGDETARKNGDFKKLVTRRIHPPPFDVIVEVRKGEFNSVRVIKNAAAAVDLSLEGKGVIAEERTRSVSSVGGQPTFYLNVSTIESLVS